MPPFAAFVLGVVTLAIINAVAERIPARRPRVSFDANSYYDHCTGCRAPSASHDDVDVASLVERAKEVA